MEQFMRRDGGNENALYCDAALLMQLQQLTSFAGNFLQIALSSERAGFRC